MKTATFLMQSHLFLLCLLLQKRGKEGLVKFAIRSFGGSLKIIIVKTVCKKKLILQDYKLNINQAQYMKNINEKLLKVLRNKIGM